SRRNDDQLSTFFPPLACAARTLCIAPPHEVRTVFNLDEAHTPDRRYKRLVRGVCRSRPARSTPAGLLQKVDALRVHVGAVPAPRSTNGGSPALLHHAVRS